MTSINIIENYFPSPLDLQRQEALYEYTRYSKIFARLRELTIKTDPKHTNTLEVLDKQSDEYLDGYNKSMTRLFSLYQSDKERSDLQQILQKNAEVLSKYMKD